VANEVAAIGLVREALRSYGLSDRLVPRVYGWGSGDGDADGEPGWIVQEHMPGSTLERARFQSLATDDKRTVLAQMAAVCGALQAYRLPDSVTGFGGLSFNAAGSVISGAMTTLPGGPFPSYAALWRHKLQIQLGAAEKNEVIKGWHANGIRKRLESFIAHGVETLVRQTGLEKMVLVHGDFSELFDQQPTP
jgi:hypothetical protein